MAVQTARLVLCGLRRYPGQDNVSSRVTDPLLESATLHTIEVQRIHDLQIYRILRVGFAIFSQFVLLSDRVIYTHGMFGLCKTKSGFVVRKHFVDSLFRFG